MPRNTRRGVSREESLEVVARLDRKGYSQNEIARIVGVSQPQICQDLKEIRRHYAEEHAQEMAWKIQEKVRQYREIQREAWEAWELSKQVKERVTEAEEREDMPPVSSKANGANGRRGSTPQRLKQRIKTRKEKVREGRLPASEYLRMIMECLQAERELLGLDAPERVDVRQVNVDWAEMCRELEGATIDQARERLRGLSSPAALPGHAPTPTSDSHNGSNGGTGSDNGKDSIRALLEEDDE